MKNGYVLKSSVRLVRPQSWSVAMPARLPLAASGVRQGARGRRDALGAAVSTPSVRGGGSQLAGRTGGSTVAVSAWRVCTCRCRMPPTRHSVVARCKGELHRGDTPAAVLVAGESPHVPPAPPLPEIQRPEQPSTPPPPPLTPRPGPWRPLRSRQEQWPRPLQQPRRCAHTAGPAAVAAARGSLGRGWSW